MSGAAEIAAGLTKAQREALVDDYACWAWRRGTKAQVWNGLKRKGLAVSKERLTPLGLEVRKHLQENPDALKASGQGEG